MLASLLVMALWAVTGFAQDTSTDNTGLKWCGGQQYEDGRYTCFNDLLCPIVHDYPYSRCGDGCYNNLLYDCSDNKIIARSLITRPYKLVAYNPVKLVFGSVEACGQEFRIKEGGACSYCPSQVGNSCPPGKETVLLPGGSGLDTLVPGGQRFYYSQLDGSMGYTQAHSGAIPANTTIGVFRALEGGAFYMFEAEPNFVSCPSMQGKIYAKIADWRASIFPEDCFSF